MKSIFAKILLITFWLVGCACMWMSLVYVFAAFGEKELSRYKSLRDALPLALGVLVLTPICYKLLRPRVPDYMENLCMATSLILGAFFTLGAFSAFSGQLKTLEPAAFLMFAGVFVVAHLVTILVLWMDQKLSVIDRLF